MKIKVSMDMAYSEATMEEAAERVAKQFGVLVEVTNEHGAGGGWPEVDIIGTPAQVLNALTSEGGWSCGDDETDAEVVYYAMKSAKVLYG